ncbi:universal stress protein [Alcaligenaceae bacterium]|nr:universal stress protein [Alcaligenaceae bacterium]
MYSDKKILACVDSSPIAEAVIAQATWASKRIDAPIELLHVLERQVDLSSHQDHSGSIGLGAQEKLLDQLANEDEAHSLAAREAGRLLLNRLRDRALAAGATSVDTRLRHGDIIETLAEQQEGSRLLVLGRALSKEQEAKIELGTHLEWVVRAANRPVLVATENAREPRNVLFAFDGSGDARKGVETLTGISLLRGLSMCVLMAGSPSGSDKKHLDAAVEALVKNGIEATSVTQQGKAREVINAALADDKFDLLVMGAYGHSPLRNLFVGSKTSELLRISRVPMLLLR